MSKRKGSAKQGTWRPCPLRLDVLLPIQTSSQSRPHGAGSLAGATLGPSFAPATLPHALEPSEPSALSDPPIIRLAGIHGQLSGSNGSALEGARAYCTCHTGVLACPD